MFYSLKFVAHHPVYRLHDAAGHFLEQGLAQPKFGDTCFPNWFISVLDRSPELKRKFRDVFKKAKPQPQSVRDSIVQVWKCHDGVQILCEDKTSPLAHWSFTHPLLTDALRALFLSLYDETLGTEAFKRAAGEDIEDHYNKFRAMGQRVCPFCGLTSYTDRGSGARASYDHYLPRFRYPLSSVNFKNLVPMCDGCNERPNKGTNDVIFSDKAFTRRRVFFYPYSPVRGVELQVRPLKPSSPGTLGRWQVKARAKILRERQPVAAWKAVFNIEKRCAQRIAEGESMWVQEFLCDKSYSARPSILQFRRDCRTKAAWLDHDDRVRGAAESTVKAAFFRFLANDAPTKLLVGYLAVSTAAKNIPVVLAQTIKT